MQSSHTWPQKTRELCNHHMDSTIWNDLRFRSDDIVISTYAKSGTTWAQQIISQLLFAGERGIPVADMSPWLDLRVPPKEVKLPEVEAQVHRRFIKTHLPVDALVFSPEAKYIYIGRDGRDVVWSLHNHFFNALPHFYETLNDTPGRVGPPVHRPSSDIREYFLHWLDNDGAPLWSFWENIRSWWEIRNLPNVHVIHFTDLKRDLPGQMRMIADFLEIAVPEDRWDAIMHHCSFEYMKENAASTVPLGGIFWEGGAKTFIHKGINGRWADVLSEEDCSRYLAKAETELGRACATWLESGLRIDLS